MRMIFTTTSSGFSLLLTTSLYGFILYYPYHISCAVIGWPEMAHITFIESYNGVPPPTTGLCSCIHPPSSYGGRSARYWARASILTYGPFLRRGCPGPFYLFELWFPRDLSWCYGIMVLWCYDIMVLWYYGIMVLWYYDIMVLWYYGIMVLWYYGIMVLVFEYIFSRIATGKASAASVYNFPLHSYLRSILTAGMPRSFLSLWIMNSERFVLVLWYYGIMVLWYYGVMVLWYYGVMVLWYYGIMVLWYYGIMVLWC